MLTTRRQRVAASVAVLAAAATITGVSIAHAEVAGRLPPASASVSEVLHVYLRAAKAHDCEVTEALTADSSDRGMAWCGGRVSSMFDDHPDLLSYGHIGAMYRLTPTETGGVAERCVPVDITQTNMSGAEPGKMPGWEFCFRHTPDGWRLTDQGYG